LRACVMVCVTVVLPVAKAVRTRLMTSAQSPAAHWANQSC